MALRFILEHAAVSTTIPGMRRPSHVERNLAASDGERLPPRLADALKLHRWDRTASNPGNAQKSASRSPSQTSISQEAPGACAEPSRARGVSAASRRPVTVDRMRPDALPRGFAAILTVSRQGQGVRCEGRYPPEVSRS